MGYDHGGRSRTGAARTVNQDSYFADPDIGLFVVADGAGGLANGDVASQLAVYEIRSAFQRDLPQTMDDRRECLVSGIKRANSEIRRWIDEGNVHRMASTVVAVSCDGPDAVIAHVGDSRCYRLRGDQVTRLTDDHTVGAELARETDMTEEEAKRIPYQHMLSRALGADKDVDVAITETRLHAGDVFLLCTDGVSGTIGDEDLSRLVREWSSNLNAAAGELVSEARERGGDDVTALLFQWGGDGKHWSAVRLRPRGDN